MRKNLDTDSLKALANHLPPFHALALYTATLLCELPVLFVRVLVTLALAALVLLVRNGDPAGAEGYMWLAVIPTAWAMLALITSFGGGWWWRSQMGGRAPSERERTAYAAALEQLRTRSRQPFREPRSWFVLDMPEPDAAVSGDALALSRGLFESEYLPAVLAHELGHVNAPDGRLTAALNRLVIHPPPRMSARERDPRETHIEIATDDTVALGITFFGALLWLARKSLTFAEGGFGLRLLSPFWGSYWREREYAADAFAARLGEAGELADFLEVHALMHDHPVPFIWLSEHTHPPTELRIERLRAVAIPTPADDVRA
jgi:Zn-dependent protease with chaperone function